MDENINEREPNPGPILTPLAEIERGLRAEVLVPGRALRGLQRVAVRNPTLRRQIEQGRGLARILTSDYPAEETLEYASRFVSLQTATYLDRFFDGNPIDTLTLPELAKEVDGIKTKLGTIADQMEQCCDEIIRRLKDLDKKVEKQHRRIIKELNSVFRGLKKEIKDVKNTIKKQIHKNFKNLNQYLKIQFQNLRSLIQDLDEKLSTAIQSLEENLGAAINGLEQELKIHIDSRISGVNERLNLLSRTLTEISIVLASVEGTVSSIETTLIAGLSSLGGEILAEGISTRIAIRSSSAGVIERVKALEFTVEKEIQSSEKRFEEKIQYLEKRFEEKIQYLENKFEDFIKIKLKDLAQEIAIEVSLSVVGESYIKWDSVSQYYPTLCFVFNELTDTNVKRKTQIKIRLLKKSSEISQSDVLELTNRVSQISDVTYTYGAVKGNYVASDKRWKTSIYGISSQEVVALLEKLCTVTGETVNPDLFSFTQNNRRRPNLTRRELALGSIPVNTTSYDETFVLKLKRVFLLINGLNRPEKLF